MKLYRITITLNEEGITYYTKEMEVEQTPACYVANKFRLAKSSILIADTNFRKELSDEIIYFTYCLDGDIETAKTTLLTKVGEEVLQFEKEIENLKVGLRKGIKK